MLDSKNSGNVEIQSLISRYNAPQHPDASRGRPVGEVYKEFIDTFDAGYEIDGHATEKEFLNYYANISAFVSSDVEFEAIVRHVWRDTNRPGSVRGRSGSRTNRHVTYKSTLSDNQSQTNNNGAPVGGFANKLRGTMIVTAEDTPESLESSQCLAAAKAPIILTDGTGTCLINPCVLA